jgi:hypothetical protein
MALLELTKKNDQQFNLLAYHKFPQAQRIAQSMAAESARVGLTESEWLRRSAK